MVKKSDKYVNDGNLSYRAPDYLGDLSSRLWRKVTVFLEENSAVNRIDTNLVEMYCTQYEIYRHSYDHIKENGEVQAIYKHIQDFEGKIIDKSFQGFRRNPMTNIYSDSIKNLTKIGSELGLSPKSRSELLELARVESTDDKSSSAQMKAFFSNEED
ncbi:phage terminase small subunit P27 family [Leuconostoc carnosum]|uniref:phage terminase small subunit P27 family n=1 Tax=Leuconostoc carnosum TaxID=1252 RepID=UPI00272E9A74|nr:phage terminase small subunit P27 family [Leuconostoc carnosum]WLC98691.1 phage terminase small subunit P27 family [Leuconostoc carnosum]